MAVHTSMIHVRVDDRIKAKAAQNLELIGLSVSDAVRILLTRIANEGGIPPGLIANEMEYNTWFRAKVQEALEDPRPGPIQN
ncbi:MAG: type II toxin-antitoxin system RelB/DinJ family antitoxin [Desulfovibrio sp.]|jgi:DNA-damage-inducible protein J|nr:type II toxin-antitoxin system RelB/DinJ family antitoxin [Desulfovibrio sp.]